MKQKRSKHAGEITDKEIVRLFERFSGPMVLPCVTSRQKQSASGIAKILWLRLVTGTDTQDNIYEDLSLVFKDNHDSNLAMGSMYFFKMKPKLTDAQITNLKKHYSDELNLNRLKNWESPVSTDLS